MPSKVKATRVVTALREHLAATGRHPTNPQIAALVKCSTAAVRLALSRLEVDGYIVRVGPGGAKGRAQAYEILPQWDADMGAIEAWDASERLKRLARWA